MMNHTSSICLVSLCALLLWSGAALAQPMVLVGATVVNPGKEPGIENAVVIIKGDRIVDVGAVDEVAIPDGAEVIDVSGRWIIPGLVDGHVHFFQSGGLYTRPDVIDLRDHRAYEEELALIRERLPDTFVRYLRSGITSVVDVGGPRWNFDVRGQAEASERAPTVVAAGPLISSIQPAPLTTDDPPILRIDTPEAAREEVRRQIEAGADLIKIWYIVQPGETPEAFRPVVEATIDEAREAGVRVAVHATELETARAAVEAGADILVHSIVDREVDDDFIEKALANDVLYTTTIMVTERYQRTFAQQLDLTPEEHRLAHPEIVASLFDLRGMDPEERPGAIRQQMASDAPVETDATALRNLATLHGAGVTVVAGTDAGNIGTLHGPSLLYELRLMQEAGLSPHDILTTATRNGARLMGHSEDRGVIAEGMIADLLVLDRDPREDVANWSAIHRVIKHGVVFSPQDLVEDGPGEVAHRFVNAVNDRNADALAHLLSDQVVLLDAEGEPLAEGRDTVLAHYAERFDSQPHFHIAVREQTRRDGEIIQHVLVHQELDAAQDERVMRYRVHEEHIYQIQKAQ